MSTAIRTRLFTVEEFHKMGEAGILTEDDRVELIQGEIIPMTPIGPRQAACVNTLARLFIQRVPPGVIVHIQNPISLDQHTEVYPDVALLRSRKDRYHNKIPVPADVLLLVEVADTTVAKDQAEKCPLYARHDVPEVWIIDLVKQEMLVYWNPSGDHYQNCSAFRGNAPVAPRSFPNFTITPDEIFS